MTFLNYILSHLNSCFYVALVYRTTFLTNCSFCCSSVRFTVKYIACKARLSKQLLYHCLRQDQVWVRGNPRTLLLHSPTIHPWITAQTGLRGAGSKWFDKAGDGFLSCIYSESSLTCQVHVKKSFSKVSLEMLCQAALGTREDGIYWGGSKEVMCGTVT